MEAALLILQALVPVLQTIAAGQSPNADSVLKGLAAAGPEFAAIYAAIGPVLAGKAPTSAELAALEQIAASVTAKVQADLALATNP